MGRRFRSTLAGIFLIVLLPLLILSCGQVEGETEKRQEAAKKEHIPNKRRVPVKTIIPREGRLEEEIDLTGTIVPNREVTVSSKASGTVEGVFFEKGDLIKKGQILAKLEDLELQLSLRQAEASLRLARAQLKKLESLFRPQELEIRRAALKRALANLERAEADWKRMKRLFERGIISAKEYDSARMQYKVAMAEAKGARENLELSLLGAREEDKEIAEARLQEAQVRLRIIKKRINDRVIVSPIEGRAVSRFVDEGEHVSLGQPIAQILELRQVKVKVSVSEVDIPRVRKGMEATIRLDALPGKLFFGRVTNIGLRADLRNRTFPVEIILDNPKGLCRPGMVARVSIKVKSHPGRIIPYDAIVHRSKEEGVYVVVDGVARFRPVQKGYRKGEEVIIIRGLQEGEQVIVVGQEYVEDGDRVIIEKPGRSLSPNMKRIRP